MANTVFSCHKCGGSISLAFREKVMRKDLCPTCEADLHCCSNCKFFDTGRNNECSEPQAEWVKDKEKANFCNFFDPSSEFHSVIDDASQSDLLKAAEDLFK